MSDCPTPGKKRYTSKQVARDALKWRWRKVQSSPGPLPCRIYPCGNHYHLTSKPYVKRVSA